MMWSHRSSSGERLLFLAVFTSLAYITIAPLLVTRWYIKHRKYLVGSYVTPPGWAILAINILGLLSSVLLLGFSCRVWAYSVLI